MKILWNEQRNWFQVELGEPWRDNMELVRSVGFKTSGPPEWIWRATKASTLNKLRSKSQSLVITELAFEKYKILNEQEQSKIELKKRFLKAKTLAAREINSNNWKEYFDEETGVMCKIVEPVTDKFVWKYEPPPPPEVRCFICGQPLYCFDAPDICTWCG
jgi:hypothetical protein